MSTLPADIVLPIIDYLDSPSMMNCREVYRRWLDVVESNRFLWTYFLCPQDHAFSFNMLSLFASRSNHTLRAVSIIEAPGSTSSSSEAGSPEMKKAILKLLLRSKTTLRFWSERGDIVGSQHSSLLSSKLESFPNLESFSNDSNTTILTPVWFQKSQNQKRAFYRKTSSTPGPSLFRLTLAGIGLSVSEKSILGNASATLRHFRCPSHSLHGVSFTFPNLLVLELRYVGSQDFPSGLSCPNLKVLGLGYLGIKKIDLPKNFPPSVEQLWFKGHIGSTPPSFKRGGLESIKKFYTRLNTIRIDPIISLCYDEILKLVKWRKGVYNEWKWEGAKRCPIQRLVLDFRRLDEKCLKELQKRVPQWNYS